MRSSSDIGIGQGKTPGAETGDEKRDRGRGSQPLYVVGIGPGNDNYISPRVRQILGEVEVVAGYSTYLDLIRPLISDKKTIVSGMKKEMERVWEAIETALSGKSCALVSSGDPGIYALAGLVFELCRANHVRLNDGSTENDRRCLQVEVVPGIPALCAGAALLGAPLVHDFAAVSLSDLLTPWDIIEKRLLAAAGADFVIVLYNPKSKKRSWQLKAAKEMLLRFRTPDTPAGIVTGASRENEKICLTTLENIDNCMVDMQTTVFIGNSKTFVFGNKMVTPRGYGEKYGLKITRTKKNF